ncbi:hypothetical protein FRC09_011687 [Ceratobasidium sp. 395]|nr:hypothetical protein FRC09_011687 [Ceratobasidium sp. 395]
MVRFVAYPTLCALASALLACGLPQPGTYSISLRNNILTLDEKLGNAFTTPYPNDPASQEWTLESGSVFGTFNLKNSKFGSYLGYQDASSNSKTLGKNTPTEYMLFPSDRPEAYFIVTKERQDGTRLVLDQYSLRGTRLDPEQEAALQLEGENKEPWTFKRTDGGEKPPVWN